MSSARALRFITISLVLMGAAMLVSGGVHIREDGALSPSLVVIFIVMGSVLVLNLYLLRWLRAQNSLRQDVQQQAQIIDNLSEAVVQFRADRTVTGWNAAAEKMYGWRADEAIGRKLGDVIQVETIPGTTSEEAYQHLLRTGYWRGSAVHRHRDGQRMEVMVGVGKIDSLRAEPTFVALVSDITTQRVAEQNLRRREAQLNAVIQSAPILILAVDSNGALTVARGRHLAHLLDGDDRNYTGKPLAVALPDVADRMWARCQTVLKNGITTRENLRVKNRVFDFYFSPINIADDVTWGVTIIGLDVTERQQIDASLQRYAVRIETLRQIDRSILELADPAAIADTTLEYLPFLVPHIAACLVICNSDGTGTPIAFRIQERLVKLVHFQKFPTSYFRIPRAGQSQIIYDLHQVERTPIEETFYTLGARYLVSAPLYHAGQNVGQMSLGVVAPDAFDVDHWETLGDISNTLAIAIEQANLNEKVRQYASQLERDIVELRSEEYLAQNRSLAILQNSLDAIVLADQDGNILQTNPAFLAMFAYTTPADAPASFLSLVYQPALETFRRALADVVKDRTPRRIEIEMNRQSTRLFMADVAIAPVEDIFSSTDGLVLNLRDVSRVKQNQLELQRALQRERDLSTLRSRFVSTVSHEFRTPLTVIGSSLELIEMYLDNLPTDKAKVHLQRIQDAVQTMDAMLSDVITLQRADATERIVNPVLFDPEPLVRKIIEDIHTATKGSHQVNLHPADTNQAITADQNLVAQMVRNLVTNAVKYSPPGSTVDVHLSYTASHLILQVKDRGNGIPARDQANLFVPFFRASNVGTHPGTGLGLSIVKQAVDLHHGIVTVESQLGQGTQFVVQLPKHYQPENESM